MKETVFICRYCGEQFNNEIEPSICKICKNDTFMKVETLDIENIIEFNRRINLYNEKTKPL